MSLPAYVNHYFLGKLIMHESKLESGMSSSQCQGEGPVYVLTHGVSVSAISPKDIVTFGWRPIEI